MLTKPAIFGSALILFDIYFIWYIQAVYLFQKIPQYVAKDTYMFINQKKNLDEYVCFIMLKINQDFQKISWKYYLNVLMW